MVVVDPSDVATDTDAVGVDPPTGDAIDTDVGLATRVLAVVPSGTSRMVSNLAPSSRTWNDTVCWPADKFNTNGSATPRLLTASVTNTPRAETHNAAGPPSTDTHHESLSPFGELSTTEIVYFPAAATSRHTATAPNGLPAELQSFPDPCGAPTTTPPDAPANDDDFTEPDNTPDSASTTPDEHDGAGGLTGTGTSRMVSNLAPSSRTWNDTVCWPADKFNTNGSATPRLLTASVTNTPRAETHNAAGPPSTDTHHESLSPFGELSTTEIVYFPAAATSRHTATAPNGLPAELQSFPDPCGAPTTTPPDAPANDDDFTEPDNTPDSASTTPDEHPAPWTRPTVGPLTAAAPAANITHKTSANALPLRRSADDARAPISHPSVIPPPYPSRDMEQDL